MAKRTYLQLRVLPGGKSDLDTEPELEEGANPLDFPPEAIFSSAESLLRSWFRTRQPEEKDIPFWKETAYNDAMTVLENLKEGGYLK